MFKESIKIRTAIDAQRELNLFETRIKASGLPQQTLKFLSEQVETTLLQFERQLSSGPTHNVTADRLFEGDGYKVIIHVRSLQAGGIWNAFKKLLGLK